MWPMTCDFLIAQNSCERALFPNLLGQRWSAVMILHLLVHKYMAYEICNVFVPKNLY
jgi:hypothetical protein